MSGIYFGSLEDQVNDIFSSATAPKEAQEENDKMKMIQKPTLKPSTSANTAKSANATTRSSLRIPTNDLQVRNCLIALNQPITLFGEGPADRRERLREMAWKALNGFKEPFKLFPVLKEFVGEAAQEFNCDAEDEEREDENEEFYVPGPVELVAIRRELLEASMKPTKAAMNSPAIDVAIEAIHRAALYASLKQNFDLKSSFIDAHPGSRPFSACKIVSEGEAFIGDFGGRVLKVLEGEQRVEVAQMDSRVTAIDACGQTGLLALGSVSGSIELLLQNQTNTSLTGNNGRIGRLAWNPQVLGLMASTCFDSTWRLWDCRDGAQVLEAQLQEGHFKGVMAGAWHPHGALFCTGGAGDGVVRIWDCRVGRAVWTMKPLSAAKMIVDVQFSPLQSNLIAVAGDDGRLAVNDLRMLKEATLTIPAHLQACTGLKYAAHGRLLVTGGLDGAVRLWGVGEGRMVAEGWTGGKVMAIDVDERDGSVMSVNFDRSVKVFK